MSLYKDVMSDDWVLSHSIPCVNEHVSKATIKDSIFTIVDRILTKDNNKDYFIKQMANSLQGGDIPEITRVIECISTKINFQSEENEVEISAAFASRLAYSVLGKSILLMSIEAGFLS